MTDTFEKFFEKNKVGCWLWKGSASLSPSRTKYGQYRGRKASRASYEKYVGKIPDGLEIDHLCRNTLCVRPDHLEAVTHRENVMRGFSPSSIHAKKTACPKGHPYDYAKPNGGARACRKCKSEIHKTYCRENREKLLAQERERYRLNKLAEAS